MTSTPQVSDAEGTIRVLRALLSRKGGQAYFVVAHPRTRYGVDALVPLLEKCPEFCFTCEEVMFNSRVICVVGKACCEELHLRRWMDDMWMKRGALTAVVDYDKDERE